MIYTLLAPEYMKTFACVGSACELSCCTGGWDIAIDDKTAKKYLNCKDGEWKERFVNNIEAPNETKKSYLFALNKNGNCVFLNDDRLCSIQKRFGEGYLCDVCNNYPRLYMKLGNKFNKKADLTCPEVIKKVLLSNKQITFVELRENLPPDKLRKISIPRVLNSKHQYYKNFNSLRNFSIQTLQNQEYSLTERLLILAYFFESFKDKNNVDAETVIALFNDLIEKKAVTAIFNEINTNRPFYYDFFRSIFDAIYNSVNDIAFKDYCQKFYKLNCLDRANKDTFFYIYDGEYKSFLHKNSLLMENYLVHSVFGNLFPFDGKDMWTSFVELVIRYVFTNFFLMGLVADGKKEVDSKEFLHCFAVMSRAFDATKLSCIMNASEYLENEGKNDITHIFSLIKV